MFRIINFQINCLPRYVITSSLNRFFLSNAYKCEEAWANRLANPVLQKTELNSLYHDLDIIFKKKQRVSLLDVDLFVSSMRDASFRNELEDILLRLRLTPESKVLPERTIHAAIRWYMDNTSAKDFLNVLGDRLNYGLFPDYYLNNLLMDKYLKENDARSAVKIAVLQMLQEDFDHAIMKTLALFCCYKYLESPDIWESSEDPELDPDEEIEKVRVWFLRNPYFDDHFDIMDTNHLVGKTLWLFGRTVDGVVGTSSQLLGLVLYEKYDKCTEFLEKVIQKGEKLYLEAVEKSKEYALEKPKQPKKGKSEMETSDGKKEIKSENLNESKVNFLDLLEKVEKGNLEKGSILLASAELVKKAVKENENSDIQNQCQLYQKWEKERENHIEKEIKRAHDIDIKIKIDKIKEELKEEEEKLFFFDREEEMQMKAEEKEKEKQSVQFFVGKGKHREKSISGYIPPEISQRK